MAGWQIPLMTDDAHGSARISGIDGAKLIEGFRQGEIAVVAGFQGLHKPTCRVTTLGRGGSDTSAVALAAAISADRCDIYTDVDGVYTSDPRIVPRRAGSIRCRSRKCWKWRRSAPRSCRCARSRWPW